MFKSTQKVFLRKRKFFAVKQENQSNIDKLFNQFLKINYPENLVKNLTFHLDYDSQKRRLVIQTNSKAIANDLILKLSSLHDYFSKEGLREIVIR